MHTIPCEDTANTKYMCSMQDRYGVGANNKLEKLAFTANLEIRNILLGAIVEGPQFSSALHAEGPRVF